MNRLAPYLDTCIVDLLNEKWESVFGFDGYYQVSNLGRIKSERRLTAKGYYTKEIIRKQVFSGRNKLLKISFSIDGTETQKIISNVVAESFGMHKTEWQCIHHINLNPLDNRLKNLCIITRSEMLRIYAAAGYMPHLHINNQINTLNGFWNNGVKDFDGSMNFICTRCLLEKKVEDFPKSGHTYCKDCELRRKGVVDIGRNKRYTKK